MKAADGRHLVDDQMIAVYIGAEPRFGRPNTNVSHLRTCAACARRYQELVEQLSELRDDASAEADAIFTPARLEAQRQQIMARLEHASHPARVIPFPSHGSPNLSIFTGTQVRRWIAAAAAAGLIIGVTLGRVAPFGAPQSGAALQTQPVERALPAPVRLPAEPTEEEILSQAEQVRTVGEMQVPASLEALSAITPINDAALRLRPRH